MSPRLTLRYAKGPPGACSFEFVREDGSGETARIDADEAVLVDLLRCAVERETRLRGSFFGILGKIGGYQELTVAGGAALGGEIAITERVVGALIEVMADEHLVDEKRAEALIERSRPEDGRPPRWLSGERAASIVAKARELKAGWDALSSEETLELVFD